MHLGCLTGAPLIEDDDPDAAAPPRRHGPGRIVALEYGGVRSPIPWKNRAVDRAERLHAQERLASLVLAGGDDGALRELARELASTINEVVTDEELWVRLAEDSAIDLSRRQLGQLILLDWEAFLPELDPEHVGELEDEFINAVVGAAEEGRPAWGELRRQLKMLAARLDRDAIAIPPDEKRWRRTLRDRVGYGVSALRRVRLGSLLSSSLRLGGEAGTATGLGTLGAAMVMGIPFGPVAPVVGAVIGGLAIGPGRELRRCFEEETEARSGRALEVIFEDPALLPETAGARGADLELIQVLAGAGGVEEAATCLAAVRSWAARVGVRLVSAWPFVAGQIGELGVRAIERASICLRSLRRSLF